MVRRVEMEFRMISTIFLYKMILGCIIMVLIIVSQFWKLVKFNASFVERSFNGSVASASLIARKASERIQS